MKFFLSKISILGSKYAISEDSKKLVRGDSMHMGVVDQPTIVSIFFCGKRGFLRFKYEI